MRPLRCCVGLHVWNEDPPLTIEAIFPAPWEHKEWKRTCLRCGKMQRWLPGYGGSELGCWLALPARPQGDPTP